MVVVTKPEHDCLSAYDRHVRGMTHVNIRPTPQQRYKDCNVELGVVDGDRWTAVG